MKNTKIILSILLYSFTLVGVGGCSQHEDPSVITEEKVKEESGQITTESGTESAEQESSANDENLVGLEEDQPESVDHKTTEDTPAIVDNNIEDEESQLSEGNLEDSVITSITDSAKEPSLNQIPVYRNKRVDAFIRLYTEKKRELFQRGVDRSAQYISMIHRIFKEHGLPLELSNLAAVESNFNPVARSHARATGMWQFMSYTGKVYDLNQSWWHDERLDPEKSTVAAAKYLKYLFNKFQNWELALAAYNSGSGTVRKAIRKAKAKGKNTDFWSLRLPRETRGYVPAFMAVSIITRNLEAYNFTPPPTNIEEKKYKVVDIPGGLTLSKIAALANIKPAVLKEYNPSLRKGMTPANAEVYPVMFPQHVEVEQSELDKLAQKRVKFWKLHRVRRGDSLWKISRRYRIPMNKIIAFNGMRRSSLLRIGKKILLPIPGDERAPEIIVSEKSKKRNYTPTVAGNVLTFFHEVRKGDTLWGISQTYNISVRSILSWNRVRSPRRHLQIGTKLKIKVPINHTAQQNGDKVAAL